MANRHEYSQDPNRNGRRADGSLDALAQLIMRIVDREVRSRMEATSTESQDVVEVVAEAFSRAYAQLSRQGLTAIESAGAYARTVARHQVNAYLSAKYPRRARLSAKVRFLAQGEGALLAEWRSDRTNRRMIGLAKDVGTGRCADPARLGDLLRDPSIAGDPEGSAAERLVRAVLSVLEHAGGPMETNALVGLVAQILGEVDRPAEGLDETLVARSEASTGRRVELRARLGDVWDAIQTLQPEHRAALLLNLRDADGLGDVRLFEELGVADRDEVCRVAGIDVAEWDQLPLPDAELAERLGTDTESVFGYRYSARRRLTQLMGKKGW